MIRKHKKAKIYGANLDASKLYKLNLNQKLNHSLLKLLGYLKLDSGQQKL